MNIYGSTELFVNEYRALLAQRLLALTSFDTEKEIRNLELLKLRFGEEALWGCQVSQSVVFGLSWFQVMLKDLADSKRIFSSIQQALCGWLVLGSTF